MTIKLTMDNAKTGLQRFFDIMKPDKITWGDIQRADPSESGLKYLGRIASKIENNLSLAEAFYVHYSPTQLEEYMLQLYVMSLEKQIAEVDIAVTRIRGFLDTQRSLLERIDEYEKLWAASDNEGSDIPF